MRGLRISKGTKKYVILRYGFIILFVIIFFFAGTGYALFSTKLEINRKSYYSIR